MDHPIAEFLAAVQAVVEFELTAADAWRRGQRPARGERRRLMGEVQRLRPAAEDAADHHGQAERVNEVAALCLILQRWDGRVGEAAAQWAGAHAGQRDAMVSHHLLLAEDAQANLVGELTARVMALERLARRPGPPDGPAAGNVLVWKGRPVKLQPLPWRILAHLGDRRSASVTDLAAAVWGHDAVTANALKSALYHLNRPLAEEGVPVTAGSTRDGRVRLDRPG